MKRSWWFGVVALTFLIAALAGCGGGGEDTGEATSDVTTAQNPGESGESEPITIGAPIASTGFVEPYDQPPFSAFEMAVEEINAEGGVDGRELQIESADTRSEPEGASTAAKKLLSQGADVILATCDFDFGSPAALAAQQEGKLAFSLCAASPKWGVQGIGNLAYTAAPAGQSEGAALAQFAKSEGWENVGVLLDDTLEHPRTVCDGFTQRAEELGLGLGSTQTFKQEDKSVQSQVNALRSANLDAVMLCSYPPGATVALRQLRNSGVDVPVLGPVTFDGTYWQDAVPGLSDMYHTAPISIQGDDPDPAANEFVESYAEQTGAPPLYGNIAIGYTTAEIIAKAIEEAGSTEGDALAAVLDQMQGDEEFLLGPITFTPETHIQCRLPLRIMQITNNEPKYVTTETPEGKLDLGVPGLPCPEA